MKTTPLDDSRHSATTEERTVLALEMIADQLALIRTDLASDENAVREDPRNDRDGELPALGHEDHPVASPSDPDVFCSTERRFTVGTYRYTDLQHAIAEAKRARREAGITAAYDSSQPDHRRHTQLDLQTRRPA